MWFYICLTLNRSSFPRIPYRFKEFTLFSQRSFQPIQDPGLLFNSVIIFSQAVGLLGQVISSSQGFYVNTGQQKHRINAYTHQTSMLWVGFEPTIPAFERAKEFMPETARLLRPARSLYWQDKKFVNMLGTSVNFSIQKIFYARLLDCLLYIYSKIPLASL
jgi:hypothetical protein